MTTTLDPASNDIDHWWKRATGYQVWPASFKDSNGDGVGDIPGIISKLDYLKDLGIDLIWLSPMYESPWADYGYDIANYENVHPQFGTLADMDKLIREMDARGMNLILDLVVNHTSSLHAWFQESKSSKDNDKSDWYIWRPPKYDSTGKRMPPSNCASLFGGSAWEYVLERDEYYFHLFEKGQPDLNWENKDTRHAVYESAVKFWLRRGVKGFRVDTGNIYAKDQTFRDMAITVPDSDFQPPEPSSVMNHKKMHSWLQEMRKNALDEFGDIVMISEMGGDEPIKDYIAGPKREYDALFDFQMVANVQDFMFRNNDPNIPKHHGLMKMLARDQALIDDGNGWVTAYLENHDTPRTLSIYTSDDPTYRVRGGKLLAMLIATLSGTLFIYQGQEIGMTNVPNSWDETDLRDPPAVRMLLENKSKNPDVYQSDLKLALRTSRDNCRTPVQWDASENAGFGTGTPWIRVNDNYKEVNVEKALADKDSVLWFWKMILKLRKKYAPVMIQGKFQLHSACDSDVVVYSKASSSGQKAVVLLNLTDKTQDVGSVVPAELISTDLKVLVHNQDEINRSSLGPWEGQVLILPEP